MQSEFSFEDSSERPVVVAVEKNDLFVVASVVEMVGGVFSIGKDSICLGHGLKHDREN